MAKIASKFESNSPKDFAVANMDELAGCRNVKTKADLYSLPKSLLSKSKENTDNDAIGLIWYVLDEGKDYRLTKWIGEDLTWEEVKVSGESSNIKVLDTLESQSITDALSANLGYILNQSKADKSELDKYLTEHLSLKGYATETFVIKKIAEALLDGGGEIDLSIYETIEHAEKTYLPKGDYLTKHQSLKDYATKLEVTDEINQKFETIKSSNVIYLSTILDKELVTPNDLGGIKEGTKISDLEGRTLSELWDDLLFPTILPTFQNPSANIRYNGSLVQEVHAIAPSESEFTTSFNKGKILINGEFADDRSGELISSQSFIHMVGISYLQPLPSLIELGDNSYQYKASYGQGPQPKNNKGDLFSSPLPSGSVESNVVTINGTYPFFASTSELGAVKQPLVRWANSMIVEIENLLPSAQIILCFKVPREAKKVYLLNTLNGKYELSSLSLYDKSTEIINVNGEQKTYYVYIYNGATRSEVSLKIEF